MRHNSCALLWERNEPFRPSLFVCCCFSCSHTTRRLLHFANDQLPKIHWGCYLKSELHDNNVGQWLLTMVLQSSNLIFSPSQGLPLCLGLKNETFRYTPLTCLNVLKGQRDGVSWSVMLTEICNLHDSGVLYGWPWILTQDCYIFLFWTELLRRRNANIHLDHSTYSSHHEPVL